MNVIEQVHSGYVQDRRVRVLSEALARQLPRNARVLDIGAGDGSMADAIRQKRPDLEMRGLDVLVREKTFVPVAKFDGMRIPEPDGSYDVILFVDVLHHTEDPMILLREALRVMRQAIVIKDHLANGFFADRVLKFMDQVGNRRFGVRLPHNYWPEQRWRNAFKALGLAAKSWQPRLGLYPWPASLIFDRNLHFIVRLESICPLPGHPS
jgi:SAM-dependent methyltransferase